MAAMDQILRGEDRRPPRVRHDSYYYTCVVICVEDTLYRIPKRDLKGLSDTFDSLLLFSSEPGPGALVSPGLLSGGSGIANSGPLKGQRDDNPVVLEGCTATEFDSLLKLVLPHENRLEVTLHRSHHKFDDLRDQSKPVSLLSKDEWRGVLKLSTAWQMYEIRTVAVQELSPMISSGVEKIQFAREYRVRWWFIEGVTALAQELENQEIPIEEVASALGWEITARVLRIQPQIRASEHYTCSRCETDLGDNEWCGGCGEASGASVVVTDMFAAELKALFGV